MTDSIVTINHIKQKARDAFARGVKRDDHGMNWHALALPLWLAEWDRCKTEAISARSYEAALPIALAQLTNRFFDAGHQP